MKSQNQSARKRYEQPPGKKSGPEYRKPKQKTGNLGNLGKTDPSGDSAPFKSPRKEDQEQENDGDITD